MNPIIAFNVISKQFTTHRNALMKLEYDINTGADTTVYVQLHDFPAPADLAAGHTAPTAGSVPIKTWPAPTGSTNNYKEFKNGELAFNNGAFACVSTTQATLTIGTVNNKFDCVAGEFWDKELSGVTTQQGSALGQATVWSEANGLINDYRLRRFIAVNLGVLARYLMLFTRDSGNVNNGDTPIAQWSIAATGDSAGADILDLRFSDPFVDGGLFVRSQASTLVNYQGCTFFLSSTPTTLTKVTSGGKMNTYSEYK